MILRALELTNFRQFHGQQRIDFVADERNVNVIHGSNGSGKTTLLNALTWLFYDELSLPRPDHLASERAMAEADSGGVVEVAVQLEFEHDGLMYTARRERSYRRAAGSIEGERMGEQLSLTYVDEDGNHRERENPQDSLDSIVPERLKDIFFFDGETIDQLTALDSQEQIQEAIRSIMGLEILERAHRHLQAVRKRFEKVVREHGSEELDALLTAKDELEQDLEQTGEAIEETKRSVEATEESMAQIDERLRETDMTVQLQNRRDQLTAELTSIEKALEENRVKLSEEVSEQGLIPLLMPALEDVGEMLDEKRKKGEIPSDIKTQFVDDLLDLGECICGRDLDPGSPSHEAVAGWRQTATDGEFERAAVFIGGQLGDVGNEQAEYYHSVDELITIRTRLQDRFTQVEEGLSEISAKVSESGTEDVAELENRRGELAADMTSYNKRIGALEEDQRRLGGELNKIKEDIRKAEKLDEKAQRAAKRAETAEALADDVEGLFEEFQERVRSRVNEKVNDTFSAIIAKEYYAHITEDYGLQILKDVGSTERVPVAKSTGERQVASLSFIASLVDLARERYEQHEEAEFFTGGIYPLIMDSPFGALDPTYQERVSRTLPEMSRQILIFVTDSQWSEAVAGEMEDIAGRQYHLEYERSVGPEGEPYETTTIHAELEEAAA
jgi:DNA sulfur modification protein DndD